jgi:hypothetical protein
MKTRAKSEVRSQRSEEQHLFACYRLAPDYVQSPYVKVVDFKYDGPKLTHLKFEDSPCWVPVANVIGWL